MAKAKIANVDHYIVPESKYDEFLAQATDPDDVNYWDVVLDLPKTVRVKMEAYDNAYALYEMVDGTVGTCHVGRAFHPVLPGTGGDSLQVFGTEGNLLFGAGHRASIISTKKGLLPHVDDDGWYHIPNRSKGPYKWPQPPRGGFNYYHESSQHFINCILENREPLMNVDWGLHITEMMAGVVISAESGQRYDMTTTIKGL